MGIAPRDLGLGSPHSRLGVGKERCGAARYSSFLFIDTFPSASNIFCLSLLKYQAG